MGTVRPGGRISRSGAPEPPVNTSTSSISRRIVRLLLWLPLLAIAVFGGHGLRPPTATADPALADELHVNGSVVTVQKAVVLTPPDTTGAVRSGSLFRYWITVNATVKWPGPLAITDAIPPTLEYVAASPAGNPNYTGPANHLGGTVTFTPTPPSTLSQPFSASYWVDVRFPVGVTCPQTVACNRAEAAVWVPIDVWTAARMRAPKVPPPADPERRKGFWAAVESNEVCVTATSKNPWTYHFERITQPCPPCGHDVVYQVYADAPSGSDIGGQNLTGLTINGQFPAGSIVTSVNPMWSGSVPLHPNSNAFSLPVPASATMVHGWNTHAMAYVHVTYPCALFPVGTAFQPAVDFWWGTACLDEPITKPTTIRLSEKICADQIGGTVSKSLHTSYSFPNNPYYGTPCMGAGCCGRYDIAFQNDGNVPITNVPLVLVDDLPAEFDATSIHVDVPAGLGPVTLVVASGAGCTTLTNYGPYTSSQNVPIPSSAGHVCRVEWHYQVSGGSIPSMATLSNSIDVCGASGFVPSTTTPVTNWVSAHEQTATGTLISKNHHDYFGACGPKVLAAKFLVGKSTGICTYAPGPTFDPGDVVRWRIVVANVGNGAATNVSITDALPPGLTYVGNPTYAFGALSSLASPTIPPCSSLTTAIPLGGSDLGGGHWNFPTIPSNCTGAIDALVIEFDAKIDETAEPKKHVNVAQVGWSGNTTNASAELMVSGKIQMTLLKEVRLAPSGPWSTSLLNVPPGSQLEYRLSVINSGNLPLDRVCAVDLLPHVGDIAVLPTCAPRNSQFAMPTSGTVTAETKDSGGASLAPVPAAGFRYTAVTEPQRAATCLGTCGVTECPSASAATWSTGVPPAGTPSLEVSSSTPIPAGGRLEIIVPVTVPSTTALQLQACNSFAARAEPVGIAACTALLRTETANVCVTTGKASACPEIATKEVSCAKDGTYQWLFVVKNLSTTTITEVRFPTTTPTITPNPLPIGPIAPGGSAVASTVIHGGTPGSQICFGVEFWSAGPVGAAVRVCGAEVCVKLPICPTGRCDDATCLVRQIDLGTGLGSGPLPAPDPHWVLVSAPPPPSGMTLNVNAPAWQIPAIPSWNTIPGSGWISAYWTSSLDQNNPDPAPPYVFRRCFCVCKGARGLEFDLQLHCDNNADVVHVAPGGTETVLASQTDTTTNAFRDPPLPIHVTVPLAAEGVHCIELRLRNLSSVAMGADLAGTVKMLPAGAGALLSDACCDPTVRIVGIKYNDRGCDGVIDGSDPGLVGFQFQAVNTATNASTLSTTSDSLGQFSFPPLPAGTYVVTEVSGPPGWALTSPAGGSYTLTLAPGSIGHVVFSNCDACETLFQDVGERICCGRSVSLAPVAGWSVESVSWHVLGQATMQSLTVAGCPSTLNPANVAGSTTGTVQFAPPCGSGATLTMVTRNEGEECEVCVELTAVISRPLHPTPGQLPPKLEYRKCTHRVCFPCCNTKADCPGTLVVHKFDDVGNDKSPAGDAGLAGVAFTVKNGSTVVATGTTNASGLAWFTLPVGSYTVVEAVPVGWTSTTGASQPAVITAGGVTVVEFGDREVKKHAFDLSIEKKMAPSPLVAGGTATATITLTNNGPGPCPGPIVVTDTWTPAASLVFTGSTASPAAGWTLSGTTWTSPGPIPANTAVQFTYTFLVPKDAKEGVRNCAKVRAELKDTNPENDESCVVVPIGKKQSSDLDVTKRMEPNPLVAGGNGLATITLVNQGPAPCPGPITVSDVATPSGSLILGTPTPPPGWTYANGVFTWPASNGPLPVGTTVFNVPFQVSPDAPRIVTNCAMVRSEALDPNPRNNRDCIEVPVRPRTEPFDLHVTKEMPVGPIRPGASVTALITVVNHGPGNAPGPITLTDLMTPSGIGTIQQIVPQQPGWTVNASAGTATHAAPLGVNQPQQFQIVFVVDPKATGVLTNCAFVQSMIGDTDPSNDRACVERPIAGGGGGGTHDLRVTKAMSPRTLIVGSTATATIVVVNSGTAPCPGPITVTDVWTPTGALTCIQMTASHPADWQISVPTATATYIGSGLAPNTPQTFQLQFQVNAVVPGGDAVRNCARVECPNDDDRANNESCVVRPIVRRPGPGGAEPSTPIPPTPFPVTPGGSTPAPGGGAEPVGRLCFRAFLDRNVNGRFDRGDTLVPGVGIALRGNRAIRGLEVIPSEGDLPYKTMLAPTGRDGMVCVEVPTPFEFEALLADSTWEIAGRELPRRTVNAGESAEVAVPLRRRGEPPNDPTTPGTPVPPTEKAASMTVEGEVTTGTLRSATYTTSAGRSGELGRAGTTIAFEWVDRPDGGRTPVATLVDARGLRTPLLAGADERIVRIAVVIETSGGPVTYSYTETPKPRRRPKEISLVYWPPK